MSHELIRSRRAIAIVTAVVVLYVLASVTLIGVSQQWAFAERSLLGFSISRSDCDGWDPQGAPSLDPPRCLRAKQFRQIQQLLADPKYDYEARDYIALRKLERCALGLIECPPQPLILSTWWFHFTGMQGGHAGEEMWMAQVHEAVEEEGFIIIYSHRMARMLHLSRTLSQSLHMVWMSDSNVFNCVSNPRCIRQEDYRPAEDAQYRHDLSLIPANERGQIPLWKLFVTSYWGSRPTNAPSPGFDMHISWGLPRAPEGNEVWSFTPLGRRWQIAPFPYPGHSWIPFSMQSECLHAPIVPFDERNSSTLILTKKSSFFYTYPLNQLYEWPKITAGLAAQGAELVAAASEDNGPVPEGIVNRGMQSKVSYVSMMGSVKAMLGIVLPEISPSPYLALCRGTPVVLPYAGDDPTPSGWLKYNAQLVQHGPMNEIGEPYVYTYKLGDTEDLEAKLLKAMSTPIEPYIPPDHDQLSVKNHVRQVVYYNYEAEYRQIVEDNGGHPPSVPSVMLEMCWARSICFFGPHQDDYQE